MRVSCSLWVAALLAVPVAFSIATSATLLDHVISAPGEENPFTTAGLYTMKIMGVPGYKPYLLAACAIAGYRVEYTRRAGAYSVTSLLAARTQYTLAYTGVMLVCGAMLLRLQTEGYRGKAESTLIGLAFGGASQLAHLLLAELGKINVQVFYVRAEYVARVAPEAAVLIAIPALPAAVEVMRWRVEKLFSSTKASTKYTTGAEETWRSYMKRDMSKECQVEST